MWQETVLDEGQGRNTEEAMRLCEAIRRLFPILLLKCILECPRVVSDGLDEETRDRMRKRAEYLDQEMAQLLQELEHRTLGQIVTAWGALLWAALHEWQFWAFAGVLFLGLCWKLGQDSSDEEDSSDAEESSSTESEESEGEDPSESDLARIYERRIQWSVHQLAHRRRVVEELVSDLLHVFNERFLNSFFPVLQPPIGVGSACEGWSPQEEKDVVYCMLVPLKPPCGHTFHLELNTAGEMSQKSMRVCVELVCTCTEEQLGSRTLCFLHHCEEELKRNQEPNLLQTLCTGPYLDVQKIALWFQKFVTSAWEEVPRLHLYSMKVLPSTHSCKLKLKKAYRKPLLVEIIFGVQQGDSDIFLSSQPTEALVPPSTTWLETYAVAEAMFFQHISGQAPRHSCYLKCLQLCARILVGTSFSPYILKTVVMHLLTLIPLAGWSRSDFLLRLDDVMQYLRCCVEEKHLKHFFCNEDMPEEIGLPKAFQTAQPINLFQNLVQDPHAHAQALCEVNDLKDNLRRQLFYGIYT
ncbi:inositol 1,4,5-trisphosphate receptor-interacting protein-like 1 [Neopelma chrysocephalum]|uniref:inositol 1,4,5-trisphosphate receptor-interacting protein-like 1 n=1 Tax=Neopelma chrysocephalum TaxID=114329 RepID=UPI000FCD0833|nr:inositol 1,4,5-trisphosphate receptor-interacting protein-like 1 [Neopelma chrysocephalum]